MGYGGTVDYVETLRNTVIAVMIEKKGAVDDLEEILSIPGVDMVQWGGGDYSMNTGRIGGRTHPDVLAARDKVFSTSLKLGVPARAEIQSEDEAKEFLDMGVRHFSIGTDITILHNWWKEKGDALSKILSALSD